MAYLYDLGWRQGSVFRCLLPFHTIRASPDGIAEAEGSHDLWAVVTQDCDLAAADETTDDPIVELRPIYQDSESRTSGIRSREVALMGAKGPFLHGQSPRVMLSPAALIALTLLPEGTLDNPLTDRELTRLKTWLGKRYDRPAVPKELAGLAKHIAAAVKMHKSDSIVPGVRDVLWQAEMGAPPRFSLYAVLDEGTGRESARRWLAAIALEVPSEVGVADVIEAAPGKDISWDLVETSYSADVSDITWRGGG